MAKQYEMGPKLLLVTNRKSRKTTGFQMTQKSFTLDDLECQ